MTENARGTPSSGTESRLATLMKPLPAALRRSGSAKKNRPAAKGKTVMIAPITIAAARAKKLRRLSSAAAAAGSQHTNPKRKRGDVVSLPRLRFALGVRHE